MQFVTKKQIDQFYYKFKDKDIVDLDEMLTVFEEVFEYHAPVSMLSEEKKKKITKSLFMNPEVIKDLRESANDTELIDDEEEIMRIVHEVGNDRQ